MAVGSVCIEEDGVAVFGLSFKEVDVFPIAMGNHGVSFFGSSAQVVGDRLEAPAVSGEPGGGGTQRVGSGGIMTGLIGRQCRGRQSKKYRAAMRIGCSRRRSSGGAFHQAAE